MQSTGKVIALVIVASISLAALSSIVNEIHIVPVFGQGGNGNEGTGSSAPDLAQGSLTQVENDLRTMTDEQKNATLMVLYGYPNTPYMRSSVMTDYVNGHWVSEPTQLDHYTEEAVFPISQGADPRSMSIVSVSPVRGVVGNLPAFKDMTHIRCPTSFTYSSEYGTFSIASRITDSYECYFDVMNRDRATLEGLNAPMDSRYLDVPKDIEPEIQKMAEFITNGATSPYAKAMALRDYLRAGYLYDFKYDPAPIGEDPVLWFLEHGKKGICTQFNSALTLMARSIGIPARYVVGFVIDSGAIYQTVRVANAHAYCEIELDGVGWVIVDAAPLSFTEPFHVDETPYWKDDEVSSAEPKNTSLAKIAGWVSTPRSQYTSAPVSGLEIGLYNGSDLVRVAKTDESGNFVLDGLDWGTYVLRPFFAGRWEPIEYGELTLDCGPYSFHVVQFKVLPISDNPQGETTVTELFQTNFTLEQRTAFDANGTVLNADGVVQEGMGVEVLIAPYSSPDDRIICGLGTVNDGQFDIRCMVPDGIATGHYLVTALAIGNSTHASSERSVDASLFDDTVLVVTMPRRVPQGVQIQVHANLAERRSGIPVKDAEIWLNDGIERVRTDDLGNATFNLTMGQVGECHVGMSYNATQYLRGSEASVNFSVVAIQAEALTDTLVRGESNIMVGRVYAVDMMAAGINVTVAPLVEGGNSTSNVTNYFGFFFITLDVPLEGTSRGPAELHVWLENYSSTNLTLRMKDRPVLTASASGSNADVELASPFQEPIPGAQLELTAGNVTVLAMTDSKGGVGVGIPSDTETVKVSFQGNADFAGAVTVVEVMPPGFDWTSIILVVAGLCAAGTGASIVYVRIRNRPPSEVVEPQVVDEVLGPYSIEFPEIERGFPAKWGVDERLKVSVIGDANGVRLLVDGAEVPLDPSGPSIAIAALLLPAGDHEIIASGPKGSSMKRVRIVDYREETARLYSEAFDALAATSRRLTRDHTPREVESIASEEMHDTCLEALEVAVSRFEVAGFSDHPFGRSDYTEMEVAVEAIKAHCERRRAG